MIMLKAFVIELIFQTVLSRKEFSVFPEIITKGMLRQMLLKGPETSLVMLFI